MKSHHFDLHFNTLPDGSVLWAVFPQGQMTDGHIRAVEEGKSVGGMRLRYSPSMSHLKRVIQHARDTMTNMSPATMQPWAALGPADATVEWGGTRKIESGTYLFLPIKLTLTFTFKVDPQEGRKKKRKIDVTFVCNKRVSTGTSYTIYKYVAEKHHNLGYCLAVKIPNRGYKNEDVVNEMKRLQSDKYQNLYNYGASVSMDELVECNPFIPTKIFDVEHPGVKPCDSYPIKLCVMFWTEDPYSFSGEFRNELMDAAAVAITIAVVEANRILLNDDMFLCDGKLQNTVLMIKSILCLLNTGEKFCKELSVWAIAGSCKQSEVTVIKLLLVACCWSSAVFGISGKL